MSTYTIGDVAQRTGFAATALRYYEGIGLLQPAGRTGAGYRVYDDAALARLGFIGRAKQLGCTLDQILDLVAIWEGEACQPVQRRLHDLVTAKIAEAERQTRQLMAFTAQLRTAASRLDAPGPDTPCDEGCACMIAVDAASTECTLDAAARSARVADWNTLLQRAVGRVAMEGGGERIMFPADVPAGALAELVVAERQCCSFFEFAITVDDRGVALEVRDAREVSGG